MLVLGRRIGEQIVLPSCDVTITVIAIKGKSVRLGFSAPLKVTVQRSELLASFPRARSADRQASTERSTCARVPQVSKGNPEP
jgi:carbon storage regulator